MNIRCSKGNPTLTLKITLTINKSTNTRKQTSADGIYNVNTSGKSSDSVNDIWLTDRLKLRQKQPEDIHTATLIQSNLLL